MGGGLCEHFEPWTRGETRCIFHQSFARHFRPAHVWGGIEPHLLGREGQRWRGGEAPLEPRCPTGPQLRQPLAAGGSTRHTLSGVSRRHPRLGLVRQLPPPVWFHPRLLAAVFAPRHLSLSLSRSTCLPRWATLLRPTTPRCASTSLYLDLQPRRSPAHNSCRRPHRAAASAHSPTPRAKRRQGPTPPPPRHDSRQHQCLLQPPSLLLGGWHVWCLGA
jgi:hypothetical protein